MRARRTQAGAALFDVIVETLETFFRLRAAGMRHGTVTPRGGGLWGLLRILKLEGPRTVPQIARARSVARQHVQKLANEMAAEGLIEFIDNPAHRRSKLMRLTRKGDAAFEELTARIVETAETLAHGMDLRELRTAAGVLRRLRERLDRA